MLLPSARGVELEVHDDDDEVTLHRPKIDTVLLLFEEAGFYPHREGNGFPMHA